jgi:hypothetical protein
LRSLKISCLKASEGIKKARANRKKKNIKQAMINDNLELEDFKTRNLAEFAARHYGYEVDKASTSRASIAMRKGESKIIIATGPNRHWFFFNVHGNEGGTILDFVMWQEGISNFGKARQVIRNLETTPLLFPIGRAPVIPRPEPVPRNIAALAAQWERLKHYPGYLKVERGLEPETIAQFRDHIRLDKYGNTIFCHRDELGGVTGWEAKNRNFTGFAPGGKKALFSCQVGAPGEPENIIIAESAIDAMSYYQIHKTPGLYISIGGALSPEQKKLLADTIARHSGARVLIATDNDPQGEEYAKVIREMCPAAQREEPSRGKKDWNDVVLASAQFPMDFATPEQPITPGRRGFGRRR